MITEQLFSWSEEFTNSYFDSGHQRLQSFWWHFSAIFVPFLQHLAFVSSSSTILLHISFDYGPELFCRSKFCTVWRIHVFGYNIDTVVLEPFHWGTVWSNERQLSFLQTLLDVKMSFDSIWCDSGMALRTAAADCLPNHEFLGVFILHNIFELLGHIATNGWSVKFLFWKLLEVALHISQYAAFEFGQHFIV